MATTTSRSNVVLTWKPENVTRVVDADMHRKMKLAVELLKSKISRNINKSVGKAIVNGRVRITERSKPGEFPRKETGTLQRSLITHVDKRRDSLEGFVGTPLIYGIVHEVTGRSFLVRTLNEERVMLRRILTKPIRK